jgi:hypothetical protein
VMSGCQDRAHAFAHAAGHAGPPWSGKIQQASTLRVLRMRVLLQAL